MPHVTSSEQNFYILIGALDASAHIYPNHITLTTRADLLRAKLRENFGGTVDGNRWVLAAPRKREALLRLWLKNTRYRREDVQAALIDLLDSR